MDTDTSWIVEGVLVAEFTFSTSRNHSVRHATIDRLTATQIVLDNGNRYSRDNLTPVGDRYSRTSLKPVDDPAVREALATGTVSHLAYEIDEIRRNMRDPFDALAKIELLVAEARAQING